MRPCKSETRPISNQRKMHLFLKVVSFALENAQDKPKSMEGHSASLRGDGRKEALEGGPGSTGPSWCSHLALLPPSSLIFLSVDMGYRGP